MEFTPEMFTGKKLRLYLGARGHGPVDIDMAPDEAIRLLLRIAAFRRKADRDEELESWVYHDREYRIGWKRRVTDVKLQVRRDGVAWRFRARTDEGTVWIQTRLLDKDDLLAALLEAARPTSFQEEFRQFAECDPEGAMDMVEEWIGLEERQLSSKKIIPLQEEDLVPILDITEDPDVRDRAMAALGRLEPDTDDAKKSEAA